MDTQIQPDKFENTANEAMAQAALVEEQREESLRALRTQRSQLLLALSHVNTSLGKLGEPSVDAPDAAETAAPTRKKPGPKPGSKRVVKAAPKAKAKGKPGPKPGKKRDLSGNSIPDAIFSVLGSKKMSAVDIMNALETRGIKSARTSTHPTLIRMVKNAKLKSTGSRRERVYFV